MEMSNQQTIKDIEDTFGIVPDFVKNMPQDVVGQMWPIEYIIEEVCVLEYLVRQ
jgi:hypothetical protein